MQFKEAALETDAEIYCNIFHSISDIICLLKTITTISNAYCPLSTKMIKTNVEIFSEFSFDSLHK